MTAKEEGREDRSEQPTHFGASTIARTASTSTHTFRPLTPALPPPQPHTTLSSTSFSLLFTTTPLTTTLAPLRTIHPPSLPFSLCVAAALLPHSWQRLAASEAARESGGRV